MAHDSLRFVLVALLLASTASVLAVGAGNPSEVGAGGFQNESDVERPTIMIQPADENASERNATTFLVYLGNPPWNTRPKYVVLRIWSPGYDELGLRVNGESPDDAFDQGVGWEFHRDLEPGRHAIYTATVERGSGPGNYSIFAAGTFVENGELTTDAVEANLSIEPVPPPRKSLRDRALDTVVVLGESIVGTIVGIAVWIKQNPAKAVSILLTAIGVFVGLSQLFIALYGRDRYVAAARWPVRRIRSDDDHRPGESERDSSK